MQNYGIKKKGAYIGGPLTDLFPAPIAALLSLLTGKNYYSISDAKNFYARLGKICEEELREPSFIPHLHNDPILHSTKSADEVYISEREQIIKHNRIFVGAALQPSDGFGGEIEICKQNGIPRILLAHKRTKLSRFLVGEDPSNKPQVTILKFSDFDDAEMQLRKTLRQPKFSNTFQLTTEKNQA